MFENLIKELGTLDQGQQVSINIPLDDKGYFDRKCPNENCNRTFKVNFEDWKNIVTDEYAFCPICKHKAPADEWNTFEQSEYNKSISLNYIQSKIGEAMKKDTNQFNKKQKPGFISMSLSYKPGNKIIPIPPNIVKELEENYACNKCKCRYSFLGTAYYCPACGNENTYGNIAEWIRNIENFIFKYSEIQNSFSNVLSIEESESYLTQLVEEHYCKIVSIFQVFAEKLFNNYKVSENFKIRRNLFQNLIESSKKWKELTEKSYEDIFDLKKYNKLIEHFQIRHLLVHTSGIIDDDFMKKPNNLNYKIGTRIILKVDSLKEFVALTKELMQSMESNWKK